MTLPLPPAPAGRSGWTWTETPAPLPERMPDGSPWPKISVVTPSFNQGQFIEETIRSVLMQGYPNLEFIIIDGASTDGTLEVLHRYEPWLAYWVSEPDRGQSHAVNKGIQRATGEIIHWLNSDDLLLPGSLTLVAQKFHQNPGVNLVVGQARIINERGEVTGELRSAFTNWEKAATNPRNAIRQVSSFFSRTLFDELGFLDETLHIAMDTELLIRFTRVHEPLILSDHLTAFRVQPGAKTASQLLKGYEETDRVRPSVLPSPHLKTAYRHNSARNWLSLAETIEASRTIRWKCLIKAMTQSPAIMLTKNSLSSIKRTIIS